MTDSRWSTVVRKFVVLAGLVACLIVVRPSPAEATCGWYMDCEWGCDIQSWYCDRNCDSLYGQPEDYFWCANACWDQYFYCEQTCAWNACI